MWKFIPGVAQPAQKKRKTEDERIQTQQVYDKQKRERKFLDIWKKSFDWVDFVESKKHMICTICVKYATGEEEDGTYVTGCVNFRRPSLQVHENSDSHQQNLMKEKAKVNKTSDSSKIVKMLNVAAFTKLTYLFRNAHYLAKTGRPYSDFKSLCLLDKSKDLDIGNTYTNDKYCQKFIRAIANTERQKQDKIISSSPFVSIISDGSTDTSSKEAEIVLLRSSFECKVYTHLIGVKNVPKADGENITKAITSSLTERYGEDWKGKVVAMGTDGASVMTGKISGVVQRVREHTDRPYIFSIHCSAHRLELAYKDGLKCLKSVTPQKCDALMLNLYLFYKYSPLNRANLKTSFQTLNLKMKIPTRVGGTRWLPHTRKAIDHILYGYKAIIQHLEQIQNPSDASHRKDSAAKARNFLKLLKDENVMFWLHALMDIVSVLSQVSEAIQLLNVSLADVWNEIQSAINILTKYKTSPGPYMRKWLSTLDDGEGFSLEVSRKLLITGIINAIELRFAGDLHLFKGSYFISFKNWPASLNDDNSDFADDDVAEIIAVCEPALRQQGIEPETIEIEWMRFKTEVYNRQQCDIKMLSWSQLWEKHEKYPGLFMLVELLLTLPSSSVDAERGFSRMKLVKNDWRSCLSDRNLSDLMLIYSESASVEQFDPTDAINEWNQSSQRSRRPFYNDQSKPGRVHEYLCDTTSDDIYMVAEILEQEQDSHEDDCAVSQSDDSDSEDEYHTHDLIALQNRAYKMMLDLM